ELLPWGDTPLRRGLATREVLPGANTGINWLTTPGDSRRVRCDIYLEGVQSVTEAWLCDLKSPRGTPLCQVFAEERGLTMQDQATFMIYREILKNTASVAPPPSLIGAYAKLRSTSVLGKTLEGAGTGAFDGKWLGWAGAA